MSAAAVSPHGGTIASGADGGIRPWSVNAGQPLAVLYQGSLPIMGQAFSPDGNKLAAIDYAVTLRVWDAAPVE